ncbi:unnamed protein product [Candida verbasci]|uniref:JmjC domain-containing histone demethylation protein 1 n=1 Tax=Candida verbasci TaxID=1227364 RepID=A0A9W4TRR9_9ASCO|nr:unnamed protein product [Candida verbasci]
MTLDDCPLCIKKEGEDNDGNVSWIQCSNCKQWYHIKCLKMNELDINEIVSYHCDKCIKKVGPSIYKRKSKRSRVSIDYVALNEGETFALDKSIHFQLPNFLKFEGTQELYVQDNLTKEYMLSTKMEKPIYIPNVDLKKVGMKLPRPKEEITVDYITESCGSDTPVEVMDVISQLGIQPQWNLAKWREYFNTPESKRDRIRNVISLEISNSSLGQNFVRPRAVEEMDLVDKVWDKNDEQQRSKVTKYCLMSVRNSFTDFHLDFGGTSVYYTVLKGKKTFLMFPPTDHNLKLYELWNLEPKQNFIWYPDYTGKNKLKPELGFKVTLNPGDLFIIPSGWIHSVHTPEDSIVIGGNYLTLRDMNMQLKINQVEKVTKVPGKFRFPMFNKVVWLSAYYYLNNKEEFINDIKDEEGAKEIITSWINHLSNHLEISKKNITAKKSIPIDKIGKPIQFLQKLESWSNEY